MVRQSRDGCSPSARRQPACRELRHWLAGCDVIRTPSIPSRETASRIDVRGTPASTRAPRIMPHWRRRKDRRRRCATRSSSE